MYKRQGVDPALIIQDSGANNFATNQAQIQFRTATNIVGFLGYESDTDEHLSIKANGGNSAVKFFSGNSERLRITSAGDVGIGAASTAASRLRVYTNTDNAYVARFDQAHPTGRGVLIDTDATVNTDPALWVKNASDTIMWAGSGGNVGIGTSSPSYALDLQNAQGGVLARFKDSDSSHSGIVIAGDTAAGWVGNSASNTGEGIYYQNSLNAMRMYTSGSERLRITSSGNVGIGTSSPAALLHVQNASDAASRVVITHISGGNSYGGYIQSLGAGANQGLAFGRRFNSNETEAMRITSGGSVGIGTSSPAEKLEIANAGSANLKLNNTSAGIDLTIGAQASAARITAGSGDKLGLGAGGTADGLVLDATNNVGIGTSSPSGGNAPLTIQNVGGSGSQINFRNAATTDAFVGLSGDANGDLISYLGSAKNHIFYTNAAERMRIDGSGNLLVGTTALGVSSNPGVKILPAENGASAPQVAIVTAASGSSTAALSTYSTGASAFRFYVNDAGTIFATSTSISAISDQRLKENVRDLDAGLNTILALKPRRFDWKEGKGKDIRDDMGFIAQEVEEVLPELIGGWKAGEGEPDDLKSVKAGDLIPVLVKAIQELTARVAQLEG